MELRTYRARAVVKKELESGLYRFVPVVSNVGPHWRTIWSKEGKELLKQVSERFLLSEEGQELLHRSVEPLGRYVGWEKEQVVAVGMAQAALQEDGVFLQALEEGDFEKASMRLVYTLLNSGVNKRLLLNNPAGKALIKDAIGRAWGNLAKWCHFTDCFTSLELERTLGQVSGAFHANRNTKTKDKKLQVVYGISQG
ncbi:MAG: hypothetical protein QW228_06935 [Candidatus Aenigmatarchaeota archaeon]